ncbi:MAG: tetratricopeptide repeat protein [Verrucomicrobia bacterium]|nr:tetratricopeptide repeat protein [Verrucomicrobiota bacterium]
MRPSISSLAAAACAVAALALFTGCTAEARKARQLEKAEKYFKAGEYEKARIEYLNVLRADEKNTVAMERMATMWLEQGTPVRALPFLLKLRTVSPENRANRMKLATALVAIGRVHEARREATSLLEKWSDFGDPLYLLSDTIRNGPDLEATDQAIKAFPDKVNALYLAAAANLSLLQGDAATARRHLQRAMSADAKNPEVHVAYAKLYLREGDAAKAGDSYKAAAENSPVRSQARMRYAEFLTRSKGAKEGEQYLNEVLRQAPDYLPARRLLATIAIGEKRLDDADRQLKEIFARDKANVEGHLLQAQVFMAREDVKKAVEELTNLQKQFPNLGIVSLNLARALLADRNVNQAVEVLEKGVSADPEHAEANLLLSELQLRRGNAEAAAKHLALLLQQYPALPAAQGMFITALRAMGKLDDAARIIGEQIKVAPKNPQLHLVLGSILRQQKKPAEAQQSFENALAIRPDFLPAIGELVDLDLAEKRFAAAMQRANDLKTKMPASPVGHFLAGRIHASQKQWKEAETALLKATEIDSTFSGAYDLLLQVYVASNQLPQAVRQLETAITQNPKNDRALTLLAMIQVQQKDYEKARDAYDKALAVRPDNATVLNNLAYLLSEHLKQFDRALELATKARALEGTSPAIADTLGWIHFRRKEYPAALPLLQEAAEKLPETAEIRYHFGAALLATGDRSSALREFRAAVSSPQDFPDKPDARAKMAELEKDPAATAAPALTPKP